MKPLYELAAEYLDTLETLENMDLDDQCIKDTLESMSGDLEKKCENICYVIQNKRATAAAIREAAARMIERADREDKQADSLLAYTKRAFESAGIQKLECPYFKMQIKKNPPRLVIDDASKIPSAYWYQPPMPPKQIDKSMLKAHIKVASVLGAHLEQDTRLEVK